jgi:hypothetical protein
VFFGKFSNELDICEFFNGQEFSSVSLTSVTRKNAALEKPEAA